jgi:predicted helicase
MMGGVVTLLALGVLAPEVSSAQMRQPTFSCANNGALRVTCQGSFLDGSSAAGVTVRVLDKRDRVVYVGTVDSQGRISFRKPDAEFHIVFDAGQGNVITILASEMT